jgi:hypothetical protein
MPSKQDSNKGVFDVSKPGSTPPDSSAKPIIVSHKPMIKDSVVKEEQINEQAETKPEQKLKAPSEKSEDSKTVIQPLITTDKDDKKVESSKVDSKLDVSTDNSKNTDQEKVVVDAVVSQTNEKKQKKFDEEAEQANKEKIDKLIESKKYFVKVRPAKAKRNKRAVLIVLLLFIIGLIGFGAAADAELVNIKVPFDFINKDTEVVNVPPTPNPETQQADQNESQKSEYVVPEGYKVYENTELGYKFTYPTIYGEFTEKSQINNVEVGQIEGLNNYFESDNPSTSVIVGAKGPFSLYNYKTSNQEFNTYKYGPDVKFENNKWIVLSINPADTVNTVGQELKDVEGKAIVPNDKNDIKSYTFKSLDESCMSTKIVFITNNKLNIIELPQFCYDTTEPSQDNIKSVDSAYKELYENVLSSISKI